MGKFWGFILFMFCVQGFSSNQVEYRCSYSIYAAPFAEVHLVVRDGKPDEFAKIVFQGRQSQETVTQEVSAMGEILHVWLSKESPDNNLEMIIFEQDAGQGNSKLINPHMPVLKEMWGHCTTDPI